MNVRLNVYGTSPANLLEKPAAESNRCFSSGHRVWDIADTIAREKEASSHVSIFVDNLFTVSAMSLKPISSTILAKRKRN